MTIERAKEGRASRRSHEGEFAVAAPFLISACIALAPVLTIPSAGSASL
jgi:hypothetical protein